MGGKWEAQSLDESSVALHEVFLSYQRAGFTRREALELVKVLLAGMQTPPDPDLLRDDDG